MSQSWKSFGSTDFSHQVTQLDARIWAGELFVDGQVAVPFGSMEKHYGLALGVVTEQGVVKGGLGSSGTFDWGGYFRTQYFADPREGTIGVLMKQTQGVSEDTGWQFRQLVGAAIDD